MNGKPPQDDPDEILEDLENLHDLLGEEETRPQSPAVEDEDEEEPNSDGEEHLPVLEERVDSESGFSDQTITTLLGDAWQDAAEALLNDARDTIGANSTLWQPEDTDELNRALKVRIDETVRAWLGDVLKAHIHVLHQRIVAELSEELQQQINNKIAAGSARQNPDQNL